MATVSEIRYQLIDLMGESENEILSHTLLNAIYYWRAKILKQREAVTHDGINWSNSFDVELEFDDVIDGCIDGCRILRTSVKIPKPIIFKYNKPFLIRTIDKKQTFDFTTPEQYEFIKHRKWTGNKNYYFYHNEYVWIPNTKLIKFINIEGIFERLDNIINFINCHNCIEDDIHIPDDIAADIVNGIMSAQLQIFRPKIDDSDDVERSKFGM